MANLQVTRSGKDTEGDIIALCGSWGTTSKAKAIRDIENSIHRYYVQLTPGATVDVRWRSKLPYIDLKGLGAPVRASQGLTG